MGAEWVIGWEHLSAVTLVPQAQSDGASADVSADLSVPGGARVAIRETHFGRIEHPGQGRILYA